ncbi:MAG TPA: AAA family ATPase, partial [Sandaracinaceae bacterium]
MARWDRLPVPSGPLLGRDAVLAAIDEAFASGARLVTLVGPAGVGKTRTAIEWAERGRRPVRFADLAGLTELGGLCREVGDVLDLALLGGSAEEHAQRIARALAARGALVLICDDLEALVPLAARTFAAWLDAAPRLAILGTSRQALGLPEERVLGIEPLGPGDGRALFLARAAYVLRREYVPNEDDLRAIDAIVARLDGLPLAIELASARIAVASPARIAALLLRELDLLADPKRANERHRSLRDALDASWALLDGPLRRALVRASVLEGEFGLDVAAGVIAHEEADPVAARIAALDRLQELAERSLVQVRDDGGERRFRLLSAIRAHARERLAQLEDGAELERVRARALLEAVEPLVAESRRSPAALRALLSESRELESVLSRAIEEGRTTDALRALAALGRARTLRGPGIPYLETAARLAPALASAPPALRADCFAWIGRVALTVGRYPDAIEAFARAEAIEREHGSISRAAVLATRIALLRHYVGDDDGADAVLAAIPDAIDAEAEANVQEARGVLALRRDRYARAREHLE